MKFSNSILIIFLMCFFSTFLRVSNVHAAWCTHLDTNLRHDIPVYASDLQIINNEVVLPVPNTVCSLISTPPHNDSYSVGGSGISIDPALSGAGVTGALIYTTNSTVFPIPAIGACLWDHDSLGRCTHDYNHPNNPADFTIKLTTINGRFPPLEAGTTIATLPMQFCSTGSGCSAPLAMYYWILLEDSAGGSTGTCTSDGGESIDVDLGSIDVSEINTSGNMEQAVEKIISFSCSESIGTTPYFNPEYKLDFPTFSNGSVTSMSTTNRDVGILLLGDKGEIITPNVQYSPQNQSWFYGSTNSLKFKFIPVKDEASEPSTIAVGYFSSAATLTIIYP